MAPNTDASSLSGRGLVRRRVGSHRSAPEGEKIISRRWAVWRVLPLLLAATILSSASPGSGVFVRFKLLEPRETSYYVQIGGYIHIEPWILPATVFPAGADSDGSKRVSSGAFTDWFDVAKYAGTKLHGQLNRAGGIAEFPNITASFVTGANSPTRKVVIELATAPRESAVVKR